MERGQMPLHTPQPCKKGIILRTAPVENHSNFQDHFCALYKALILKMGAEGEGNSGEFSGNPAGASVGGTGSRKGFVLAGLEEVDMFQRCWA